MIAEGQHVMLSYHGDNQDLASKFCYSLRDYNIAVWFEERKDNMHSMHDR